MTRTTSTSLTESIKDKAGTKDIKEVVLAKALEDKDSKEDITIVLT